MIDLVAISVTGPAELLLAFSDGTEGVWSASALIHRDTVLTRPLGEKAFFAKAFIEGGQGLAWPNGLELSAEALHRELAQAGSLVRRAA